MKIEGIGDAEAVLDGHVKKFAGGGHITARGLKQYVGCRVKIIILARR